MGRYDAIVVGGGHNGLTAALTLAKAGRKVILLERAAELGGICARREFAPGYVAPGLLPDTALFRGELIDDLGLAEHGLELVDQEPAVLAPNDDGGILLHDDPTTMAAGLEGSDGAGGDATALRDWAAFLNAIRPAVRNLLDAPPPPLSPHGAADLRRLGGVAWTLRRLGGETVTELLRVLPMCVADWMRERFTSERLAAALAAPALSNGYGGPWAPGTAGALLLDRCARQRSIAGGPAALIDSLVRACEAAGVDLERNAEVTRIHVASGRATAVELASGDLVEGNVVVAGCDPKAALLDLVGPRYLGSRAEGALRNYRSRGIVSVLLLAVAGDVEIRHPAAGAIERLRLGAGSLDDLERAFDAAKYGHAAERPYLEVWIPSRSTPGLAPRDGHVVAALIHTSPHDLEGGWSTSVREALTQAIVHQLNDYLPGIREQLAGGCLLAPPDLEQELALPGGHLGHGEWALDQMLFLRPSLGLGRYRTPIANLYLGSTASHPGPGITGMPGRLAAQTVLADGD